MNEREEIDVLTFTRALEKISPSFVKCITSGPLITHQFSAQYVNPFPRYRKEGGCARAHLHVYPTINFGKTLS